MTSTKPLGEVIEYLRGITFKPEQKIDPAENGAVVCMRTKNVQETLDQSDLIAVPASSVRNENLFLRTNDILISSANSWNLVGKCCLVPPLDYRATAGGFISIIRAKEGVDSRYLFHWLTSERVQERIRACARQTTNIANLSVPQFEALRFPMSSLSEQRRIADMLDKADAIRRKRREVIALTEQLLRSTFLEMVGPNAADYHKWPQSRLEELAIATQNSMRTGPFGSALLHSEFVDKGVAVLGIDNAVQNRFAWGERRFITHQKYEGLRRYTVHPGDVIITIMGTTGRSAVIPDDIPVAITTKHLATISLDRSRAEPEFVAQAIHTHPDVLRQISQANRGAIMSGLNLTLIRALTVSVPPLDVQRAFTQACTKVRDLQRKLVAVMTHSDGLFNSLSYDAFGENNAHRATG